jgi:DMSO/TMAO reductase YedYZ molybdopterin-dependent catalytic subunit
VNALPAGQHEVHEMPRFGLLPFAKRFPTQTERIELRVQGATALDAGSLLATLPRVEQTSDFHCVATWSKRGLRWSGVRFADFYSEIAVARAGVAESERFVVLRGQDRAHTSLPLEDLLAPDVLLADRLDGQLLPLAHGAPLRLVAPAHYGYKNIKHLSRIEFRRSGVDYKPVGFRFMQHARGRVALEERGRWVPNWLLRRLYRPFIGPTTARFERALQDHLDDAAQERSA